LILSGGLWLKADANGAKVRFELLAASVLGYELTVAETSPPLQGDGLGDAPCKARP
jgi:hypothetical protein